MMIGQLGWEKIDLIRAIKHLVAILKQYTLFRMHTDRHIDLVRDVSNCRAKNNTQQ